MAKGKHFVRHLISFLVLSTLDYITGARSNHKKAVRTQRRLTLKASWQEEADARRYANLAEAAASVSLPVAMPSSDAMEAEDLSRGRMPKKSSGVDAMETDVRPQAGKKKKGFKVKGGVQKKTHNNKKTSALWASNFHKSKRGKQGFQ